MPDFSSPAWTSQPNIYGATVQATQIPDYAAKRRLAEALRGQATSYQAQEMQPSTYSTRGSGAYPGQTDVNWGGILQNAFNSYQGASKEKQATAAAGEMETARNEALDAALKNGTINDPKTLIALSQLGVDTDVLKLAQGPAAKAADYTAQRSVAGTSAARMRSWNKIEPGYFSDKEIAEQAAADLASKKASGTTVTVDARTGEALSPIQMAMGKGSEDYGKQVVKSRTEALATRDLVAGGGFGLDTQEQWANNDKNWTGMGAAGQMMVAAGLNSPGQFFLTPEAKRAQIASNESIRSTLRDLGGSDSNSDLRFAAMTEPTSAFTQAQAKAMVKYKKIMKELAMRAAQKKAEFYSQDSAYDQRNVPPNFYNEARKGMADEIERAKDEYNKTPKGIAKPSESKDSGSALTEGDDEI